MKFLGSLPKRGEEGHIRLTPYDGEDIWSIYNIINVGDVICTDALRKVVTESSSGTVCTNKVKTRLTIKAEKIEADLKEGVIHVEGRNVAENKYVKIGAYHTLDISVERTVSIGKSEWDSYCLERLHQSLNPSANSDLMAIIMQEGLAHVCLITRSMTVERDKIVVNLPRKRANYMSDYNKQLEKFHRNLLNSLIKHANFEVLKWVVIASPGFYKDNFYKFMMSDQILAGHSVIEQNRGKFVLVHSSTGFKHSLQEILEDKNVISRLENVQIVEEIGQLNGFMRLLDKDSDRAIYGRKHVFKACEMAAVEVLLVADELLRVESVEERRQFRGVVAKVERSGGRVRVLSTQHSAGRQVAMMGGLCAILRFPVVDDDMC